MRYLSAGWKCGTAALLVVFWGTVFALPAQGQSLLERAKEERKLTIGYATELPFAYRAEDGRLTGEAPEVARRVLARMGIDEVDGVVTEFSSLIPGLEATRFDMIASALFVRPERCQRVAFSEPTLGLGQGMIVKAGNPLDLHSYKDIAANSSVRLGLMSGAAGIGYASEVGITDQQVSLYPDAPGLLAALRADRVDAISLAAVTLQKLLDAQNDPSIERVKPYSEPRSMRGYPAFAVRKEDSEFLVEFNAHLEDFVGSKEHLDLIRPFGFTEAELPDMAMSDLCAGR